MSTGCLYTHRIGATLYLTGKVTLNGVTQDMTGWTARSQIRRPAPDDAIAWDLECAWLDAAAAHLRVFAAAADQAEWQPGFADIDVAFTSPDGVVIITDTQRINLARGATR